MEKKDLKI